MSEQQQKSAASLPFQQQEPEPEEEGPMSETEIAKVMSDAESAALNEAIGAVCDDEAYSVRGIGGKNIPYIGWYWRDVDFTQPTFALGIAEPERLVGFMENNKWDYGYANPTAEQCAGIVAALREATAHPSDERLQRVNDLIQAVDR